MFTFSNYQFTPNCQKLWHLKNQFFLLLHTACISLALPLSLLPFTRDTHTVCLEWNVSQCVQIWIFNISNTDSFTQTIYLWYKYYSMWICVSFSFRYIFIYNYAVHIILIYDRIKSLLMFMLNINSCFYSTFNSIFWLGNTFFSRTRQIIRYRTTAFLRRLQIKQYKIKSLTYWYRVLSPESIILYRGFCSWVLRWNRQNFAISKYDVFKYITPASDNRCYSPLN